MPIQGENIPEWIRRLDIYFGRYVEHKKLGRPFKPMNEDLLILMHSQGDSNRKISRELGIPRRTIDYRINKLRDEGKL